MDVLYLKQNKIKEHVSYTLFKNKLLPDYNENLTKTKKEQRMHQKTFTNKGYEIEIVEYRNVHDIDVMFLIDGVIKQHTDYKMFIKGCIAHP